MSLTLKEFVTLAPVDVSIEANGRARRLLHSSYRIMKKRASTQKEKTYLQPHPERSSETFG
jgi:hypothetical protein